MNTIYRRLYLFVEIFLLLLSCFCFGNVNLSFVKNSIDKYSHASGKEVLFKQHILNKGKKTKNNKADHTHPSLKSSGNGSVSIWSNSFNFAKSSNSEVDPRTGTLLVSVKAGLLLSNFGHGPDIDLEMNYNSAVKGNPDNLGQGWAWNLTHYNPKTHQLSTAGGKSFFLKQLSDGRWTPMYHKLKDVIIISKKGHLEITSANGLRDILNHDGYETRLEQQNGEGVNFKYLPGSHILEEITDDYGHSIQLTMKNNYLIVTSYDVQGQPVDMRISLENNEVRNIWFPKQAHQQVDNDFNNIHLSYSNNYKNYNLLTDIHYFTGMEKRFTYDCKNAMKLPAIVDRQNLFQAFTPVCVVKQVSMLPGENQPLMITNYRYTTTNSNSHDYLGYNSGLAALPGLKTDILFEAPASYTYQTKEDTGQINIIRTYNKYHLLINSKTFSDKNNRLLNETQAYFCNTDSADGCANTTFDQLPVTYSLPLKLVTENWGDNLSAPAVAVIQRHYDDHGRIISQTDSYGRRTEITYCTQNGDKYCPAAPTGWPVSSLTEKTETFPAPVKDSILLSPVTTTMSYQKENNLNKKEYTLVLVKKTAKSGSVERTETRQYYNDSKNPLTYGLLKQKQLTGTNLPAGSVQQITHYYQYTLNKNNTETASAYTDVAKHQPVLSAVVEKSLFYPKTLRVTSADGKNIHTFSYDNVGRLIAQINAVGTPFETTTHYQYKLSADENSVIVTAPDHMQKKTVFDGSGRVLTTYIEKTDLQGHLQPGLWQQQTQTRYNAAGEVAETTIYTDNGQGKGVPVALTTHFDYDVLGRLIRKHLPNGDTEVTAYDDAHHCVVHYTQDMQNQRTAIIISHTNVLGNPTEQVMLPATTSSLPSITTLCTQADQQPDAKVSTMTYDGFDHLISTKDPMGNTVQYRYDAFGHVTDITNPKGDTLHDTYDLTGHVIHHWVMPVKGGQYLLASAGFNAAGQKLWSAGEDGKKTTYHYNINGLLSESYKPNGHHITLDYNIIGLPVKESLDGKPFLNMNYDHITYQPFTVTDNTGVTTYHYRDDGLLESATHKGINGYPDTFYTLTHDSYHRLISHTDTDNNKTVYTFDTLGRPVGEKYQANKSNTIQVDQLEYGRFSRIVKKIYGSGMVRMLSYDSWGQVQTIKDSLNKKPLYAASFVYDADGNIIRLQRSDDKNHKVIIHYGYDHLDNLVTMDCQGDNILCPHDTAFDSDHLKTAPVIIQQHYNFTALNRLGEVTEKLIDTSSSQWHSLSKTMVYAYSDSKTPLRLTSVSTQWNNQQPDTHHFIYDTTGNMTTDSEGNKISYNPFNQITHVVNTAGVVSSYDYDGQGKEVKIMTAQYTRQMIYQGGSLNREIVTDADNNVHDIGYPAAEIKTTDNTITDWYESNYKGDVVGILGQDKTSGQWSVQQHRVYSPYGMMWSYDQHNKKIKAFQQILQGFDGEITDPATGWQFLGAGNRTYNPAQRYFVSEDPAGDGYAFGSNNPIMNSDPSGNTPKWLGKVFNVVGDIFSLGLNKVHNKFARGIGRSLIWAAMALSYGTGNILGMVFTPPAALSFASAIKPANKGLQTASMATGGTYAGALFVAGLLAMGMGLYASITAVATAFGDAGNAAMGDLAMLTGTSAYNDIITEVADTTGAADTTDVLSTGGAETAFTSGSVEASEQLTESSATEDLEQAVPDNTGNEAAEESPGDLKRAVFACGTQKPNPFWLGCVHTDPTIDTFDIDPNRAPTYVGDIWNTEEVVAMAGEEKYDAILQENCPDDFFNTAYRLLKPGGKLYIFDGAIHPSWPDSQGSGMFCAYTKVGKKIFGDYSIITSIEDKTKIANSFQTRNIPRPKDFVLVFTKNL